MTDDKLPDSRLIRKLHFKNVTEPCVIEIGALQSISTVFSWKHWPNTVELFYSQPERPCNLSFKLICKRVGFSAWLRSHDLSLALKPIPFHINTLTTAELLQWLYLRLFSYYTCDCSICTHTVNWSRAQVGDEWSHFALHCQSNLSFKLDVWQLWVWDLMNHSACVDIGFTCYISCSCASNLCTGEYNS